MNKGSWLHALTGLASLALLVNPASAQYKVFSWESFEETREKLPASLKFGHYGNAETVGAVGYSTLTSLPGMVTGITSTENGQFGLRFSPTEARPQASLINKTALNRERLGTVGSALVQADFYMPPDGEGYPNFALLANHYDPEVDKAVYRFYRFGVLGKRVYFSFANGGPEPAIYVEQPVEQLNLSTPGWHRFQIIFYGQDRIYCAIDGQMTKFSPITDTTLTNLSPGIMVTHRKGLGDPSAYADNLSIQWSPEAEPQLPRSPWVPNAETARAGGTAGSNPKLLEADSTVGWYRDSGQAWRVAQSTQKPILAFFYVPEAEGYKYIVESCPNDEATKEWLTRFVPLRIDINQLGGGRMAENFNIYRVPAIMVMGTDGKEKTRLVVQKDKTAWEEILGLSASTTP